MNGNSLTYKFGVSQRVSMYPRDEAVDSVVSSKSAHGVKRVYG